MISLIFPTYNEQENLPELYRQVARVVSELSGEPFEFIFVDDCSTDRTPFLLRDLHKKDPRVKTIRFARNCGGHAALAAGLYACQGRCAIGLAADLQDPPVLIKSLIEQWNKGSEIVWGVRTKREGESFTTRLFSIMYYAAVNRLTSIKMPALGTDVFLVDRAVIEAFKQMPEKHTSIFLSLAWLGFSQTQVGYVKETRFQGKSKWTLSKKIKLLLDSLLSFSYTPIRAMSVLGFLTALGGFIYAFLVLWNYWHGSPIEGWSSLMVVILVTGGIQMIMLGLLGEYLWRTFDESRHRPRYVIQYVLGVENPPKT